MSKNLPTGLGRLFAHFQDLFDTLVKTVIKRADTKDDKGKQKKFWRFFSEMGDSYYRTYEEEKRKKSP